MKCFEIIKRTYENAVYIEYEKLNDKDIYIHSIFSTIKHEGNGTSALKEFLKEFQKFNIYLYATGENGTNQQILNKWYEQNGFTKCNKTHGIYNVTHCKLSQ